MAKREKHSEQTTENAVDMPTGVEFATVPVGDEKNGTAEQTAEQPKKKKAKAARESYYAVATLLPDGKIGRVLHETSTQMRAERWMADNTQIIAIMGGQPCVFRIRPVPPKYL